MSCISRIAPAVYVSARSYTSFSLSITITPLLRSNHTTGRRRGQPHKKGDTNGKTISTADRESLFRFVDIYVALSEENKKLVFAFAQGMETQRLISEDRLITASQTTAAGA